MFWFHSFCALLLSPRRTLSCKKTSPSNPFVLKQQPEHLKFWMEALSLRYETSDGNLQNWWYAMTQENRNIKFNISRGSLMFLKINIKMTLLLNLVWLRSLEKCKFAATKCLKAIWSFWRRHYCNLVQDFETIHYWWLFSVLIALWMSVWWMPIWTASQAH